eukprot:4060765-Lingulodinium_polyedra.AAC.1
MQERKARTQRSQNAEERSESAERRENAIKAAECRKQCSLASKVFNEFHDARATFIERRKSGLAHGFERSYGVKKTVVKKKRGYKESLLPPADMVLPYDVYVEKHGDPKKNKHKVRI